MRISFLLFFTYFLLLCSVNIYPIDSVSINPRSTLVKLPWAKYELEKISEIASSDVFYGNQATEGWFKYSAPKYRILHIAAHAIIDDSSLFYSGLIFNKDDFSGEDGIFYTYELYNLRLNADLTVLSACNTGVGRLVDGEGIFNLARGFMHAGTPSLIMSLWSVDDRSTSYIMNEFYSGISKGGRIGKALRKAKLKYLDRANEITASPLYWAGMVSYGRQNPINIEEESSFGRAYLLIILLVITGYVIYRRIRYNWI